MNINNMLKSLAIRVYYGNSFFRKGIHFGKGSFIRERAQICGGKHIKLGDNVRISVSARIMCFEGRGGPGVVPQITIGDNVIIGRNMTISCCNRVEIGSNTAITGYCFIADSEHGFNPEYGRRYESQPMEVKETRIGSNVFMGEKSVILPGVTIGDNCVIGACSVVTKSFGNDCMIVGNPARCIKKYNYETHCWERVS